MTGVCEEGAKDRNKLKVRTRAAKIVRKEGEGKLNDTDTYRTNFTVNVSPINYTTHLLFGTCRESL